MADTVEVPWRVVACVAFGVVFAVLTVIAFSRPAARARIRAVPYTQSVSFSYGSAVRPSPVYPSGLVRTGDPIFLQLVRTLHVGIRYRLDATAPLSVTGTRSVTLELSEPDGWSNGLHVERLVRFSGDHFSTLFSLNLPSIQSLFAEVEKLTGVSEGGGAIAVRVAVGIHGVVGVVPVTAVFTPALSFQLRPLQLQPGGVSGSSAAANAYAAVQHGTAMFTSVVANPFVVLGQTVAVRVVGIISVVGLLLAVIAMLMLVVRAKRTRPLSDEARIEAQYGQLIVPVSAFAPVSSEPINVTSIDALMRLAKHAGALVLHQHNGSADSYLVNDSGTAYRYVTGHTNGSGASTPGLAEQPPKRNRDVGPAQTAAAPLTNGSAGARQAAPAAVPDTPPAPVSSEELPETAPGVQASAPQAQRDPASELVIDEPAGPTAPPRALSLPAWPPSLNRWQPGASRPAPSAADPRPFTPGSSE